MKGCNTQELSGVRALVHRITMLEGQLSFRVCWLQLGKAELGPLSGINILERFAQELHNVGLVQVLLRKCMR